MLASASWVVVTITSTCAIGRFGAGCRRPVCVSRSRSCGSLLLSLFHFTHNWSGGSDFDLVTCFSYRGELNCPQRRATRLAGLRKSDSLHSLWRRVPGWDLAEPHRSLGRSWSFSSRCGSESTSVSWSPFVENDTHSRSLMHKMLWDRWGWAEHFVRTESPDHDDQMLSAFTIQAEVRRCILSWFLAWRKEDTTVFHINMQVLLSHGPFFLGF